MVLDDLGDAGSVHGSPLLESDRCVAGGVLVTSSLYLPHGCLLEDSSFFWFNWFISFAEQLELLLVDGYLVFEDSNLVIRI